MPDTPINIVTQKSHLRWMFVLMIIVVGAIGAGAFYLGGGNVVPGSGRHITLIPPNYDTLKSNLEIKQQPGGQTTVETQTTQPEAQASEQAAIPPAVQPASNGKSETTADGFDPDHRLQRTVTDTDRYDPLDRMERIMTAAVTKTNESVSLLADKVSSIGSRVDGVELRLSAIESKDATPAATTPAAPAPAAPASAPAAPAAGPQSSAAPATPAPQASEAAPPAHAPVQEAAADDADSSGMSKAERDFFLVKPKGFHFDSGMGDSGNLARMRTCRPPHRLEVDRDSSRCHAAGYDDPNTGKPVRRCPNRCV